MSQRLIESDRGAFLGKGGGEKSQGLKEIQVSRDGRKLALGHKLLRLCFRAESADPAAEPVLFVQAGTVEKCVRNRKRIC